MSKTKYVIIGLLVAVTLTSIQWAAAYPYYLPTFNAKYGTSGTSLDTCGLCHVDPSGGGSRNSYGRAFESQSVHFSNIDLALTNIEPQDSDGDGYSNIVEIIARTAPWDASIHPAPTPVLTTITVTPATATITVSGTKAFTAAPKDQNGNPITATITWTSSNTAVGTISSTGVLTAISAGTTTITAQSGSVTGTASATVTASSTGQTFSVTFVIIDEKTGKIVHDAKVTLDGVAKETNRYGKVEFKVTAGTHTYKVAGEHQDDAKYLVVTDTINVTSDTTIQIELTHLHQRSERALNVMLEKNKHLYDEDEHQDEDEIEENDD